MSITIKVLSTSIFYKLKLYTYIEVINDIRICYAIILYNLKYIILNFQYF